MSKKYIQSVRGTHDLIGDDMRLFRHIVDLACYHAKRSGYDEMQTPIFEFSDVFHRSLGDTSDVVSKETYTFEDRGGESLTLRPEFTAAIVRAFISNGYTQQLPFKAFYSGPAFRYERPQKGRQRQFHQIGMECLGANDIWHDVELIFCAAIYLKFLLGFDNFNQHVTLEINTLGDDESRAAYRTALIDYFTKHKESLSSESKERLEKNPLRILDSKQSDDRDIVKDAPLFEDYLSPTAQLYFDTLQEALSELGIKHTVSPRLVRGLDYYSNTVFEFTTDKLGSQATILAGGRYNNLVEQLGGPSVAGIGWAAGVERLMLLCKEFGIQKTLESDELIVINANPSKGECQIKALFAASNIRAKEFRVEVISQKNIGKALKKANSINATYFIAIDEEEASRGEAKIKNLNECTETDYISFDALADHFAALPNTQKQLT